MNAGQRRSWSLPPYRALCAYRRQTLVGDPEINLVLNGAPNHLHAQPCIAALQGAKHVLC